MVLKYSVGVRQGLTNPLMTIEWSLALVDNLSSNDVTIKMLVGFNLKTHLITYDE